MKNSRAFYGTNLNKISHKKSSVHAEINAIDKYMKNPIKYNTVTLVVMRFVKSQNGQIIIKNSKPCKHCIIEMQKKYARIIKNVIYITGDDTIPFIKVPLMELKSDCVSKYRTKLRKPL